MPVSRAFFYISPGVPNQKRYLVKQNLTFFSKSPVKEPLSMISRAPIEINTPFIYYSFIHISQYPKLRRHPSKWSPTRTEGLHTMGYGLVPQMDRWRHCYFYPSAIQPWARNLPPWLVETRTPSSSECCSTPLQCPLHTFTSTHVAQWTNLK
jgi:hypothetical protein